MNVLNNQVTAPDNLTPEEIDEFWMQHAYKLAEEAELQGEIPVGAAVVLNNQLIGEGWNRSIRNNDPTAHAEMIALKQAGAMVKNYRLIDATLYVTLEPCPMCAGAMVHARVKRVVYGASDMKTGAAGSVFNLTNHPSLNHQLEIEPGVLAEQCGLKLSSFFKARRKAHKEKKLLQKKNSYE